jgi:hypothetical protein
MIRAHYSAPEPQTGDEMNWFLRLLFVTLLALTMGTGDSYAADGHEGADKTEQAADAGAEKAPEGTACNCAKAAEGGSSWCDHCKVGHHEGKKMSCKDCYMKATGASDKDCESCAKKAEAAPEKEG